MFVSPPARSFLPSFLLTVSACFTYFTYLLLTETHVKEHAPLAGWQATSHSGALLAALRLAVPKMALAQLVAALAFRPTASPARRTNINMMEHDASTLELKAQILQVAALTDRGQRLNTLSEWHASNARPTH